MVVWLAANALILAIAPETLPLDRPAAHGRSAADQVVGANAGLVEIFALMGIVYALTRRRTVPNLAARAPARVAASRETLLLIGYGVLGQLGGLLLADALSWHAFSFHVVGTLFGTHEHVAPAEVIAWAAYNLAVYAVAPYVFFRRRYSAEALNLKSSNRRNDALVIVVVLAIESAFQLALLNSAVLRLSPHKLLLGAPLTFALYFLGSVLPAMVFIYCILVPRYLKLTGSGTATVLLGGLSYMAVHFLDGWTVFSTPANALLSVISLLLLYFGPGMFKTFLTLRTGNAWVHVWAYHALAPHTLEDTPMMVRTFRIG